MNPVQWLLVTLVRGYQLFLSPVKNALFGPSAKCRFTPTCSQYGIEAIRTHGAIKGSWLAFRRLLRCNPWGPFGPDPVPPREKPAANELEAERRGACCDPVSFASMSPNRHSQRI